MLDLAGNRAGFMFACPRRLRTRVRPLPAEADPARMDGHQVSLAKRVGIRNFPGQDWPVAREAVLCRLRRCGHSRTIGFLAAFCEAQGSKDFADWAAPITTGNRRSWPDSARLSCSH